MTRYEGFEAGGFSTVNRFTCMGYFWLLLDIQITANPSDPKLKDWSAKACQYTETACWDGVQCRLGKKAADKYNYNSLEVGGAVPAFDTPERPNFPASPVDFPAISPDGRGSVEYFKLFFLGCCAGKEGGCDEPTFRTTKKNLKKKCHTISGTVNPDRLVDPLVYFSTIGPTHPLYVKIDKVGAHAVLEALKNFGPGGKTPPKFEKCCQSGSSAGGASGGSNG